MEKRGRGRPKGSKNKPKVDKAELPVSEAKCCGKCSDDKKVCDCKTKKDN